MNTEFMLSLLLGAAAFMLFNTMARVRFFEGTLRSALDALDVIAEHIGKYNSRRYVNRIRRERIVRPKENLAAKYNRLVEGLILDLNLPFTLESFTSILAISFAVVVLVIVFYIRNVTLSVLIAVSLFIGLMTWFVMKSKAVKAERIENIMDAEDLICPLARDGVLVAIKKVVAAEEAISPNIRPYFQQFIDNVENNGYSFRQAMELLNRQLGPKFDNFARKAVIFEYNERKGMADIFLDIVDENAVLREINSRKDRIFRKMNRDFFLKTIIIILFYLYALSVDGFREFMMQTNLGKMINTAMISIICVSFARTQALQGNLGYGESRK